jgi:hypothetical protein
MISTSSGMISRSPRRDYMTTRRGYRISGTLFFKSVDTFIDTLVLFLKKVNTFITI